ncbi:unnamed protein product [Ectocarpus sp. CCAP 1310/34]|nr:unnamed protein product [Ectocarpus sp. CCAP 1310/34]
MALPLAIGTVPPDMSRFVALEADGARCLGSHGESAASDLALGSLAHLLVKEDVAHGGLHLLYVE